MKRILYVGSLVLAICGCGQTPDKAITPATSSSSAAMGERNLWPQLAPAIAPDAALERDIAELIRTLSLEQKVAQMIQANIAAITPEEMAELPIGSVLNGGGQTPNNNPRASAKEWAALADQFFVASMNPSEGRVPIPVMWGTDAVHGHGNVLGATLFPHNIGLGASGNAALVKAIGSATAREVAATGIDWNFAPTVAVARDLRWGRTYESFSQDPALTARLGAAAVEGLQGELGGDKFLGPRRVAATAKHYIGDGGTALGDDQGITQGDEQWLADSHGEPYAAALKQGVQTVMASYSWWQGVHSHANGYLLTDILKDRMGFDGFVISDWQGVGHIASCRIDSCAEAINAGVDMIMVANKPDWRQFLANTVAQVQAGEIPLARINDAVTRILRVKKRLGLWQKPAPLIRPAVNEQWLGNHQHRAIAQQAVRESLVLLKNASNALPIKGDKTVAVIGKSATTIADQAGGWSITWLGRDNPNDMYPGATSLFGGLQATLANYGGEAFYAPNADFKRPVDAAIVVVAEQPYAEMFGDIQNMDTLALEPQHTEALQTVRTLKARAIPVTVVYLGGRPRWLNPLMNAADAFVAAWLPGSEGQGVADVLIADGDGNTMFDFKGRLPFDWPRHPCDAEIGHFEPAFKFGEGLNYRAGEVTWQALPEDTSAWQYGCILGDTLPKAKPLALNEANGWQAYIELETLERKPIAPAAAFDQVTAKAQLGGRQFDLTFTGQQKPRFIIRNDQTHNTLLTQFANEGAMSFDIQLLKRPNGKVNLGMFSGHLAASYSDITPTLKQLPVAQWFRLSLPLKCLADIRADMSKIDAPMAIEVEGEARFIVRDIEIELGGGNGKQLACLPQ